MSSQLSIDLSVTSTIDELQAAVKQKFMELKQEIDLVQRKVMEGGRMVRIEGQLMHS